MPAQIDKTDNWEGAMYARTAAWHRLGTVKLEGCFTIEEAGATTGLLEPVQSVPLTCEVPLLDPKTGKPGSETVKLTSDMIANYQYHPDTRQPRIVGTVGKDRATIQPIVRFQWLDEVVGAVGGAHYEALFSLRQGRQLVAVINLGETNNIVLDPKGRKDTVRNMLVSVDSHDASLSFGCYLAPYRPECANMLAMQMGSGPQVSDAQRGRWFTRHTTNIFDRITEAKATLGLWKDYAELFSHRAEEMIEATLTDNEFQRAITDVFTVPGKDISERDKEGMSKVRSLYELSRTNQNIHGTVWGGLQATTEYFDWYRDVRGGKTSSVDEMRFTRQMRMSGGVDYKQKAWDRFAAVVSS